MDPYRVGEPSRRFRALNLPCYASKVAASIIEILPVIGSRRVGGCESGVTALEFALVAPAFFALLIAIFETGAVFLAQQVLQTATTEAARLIMTGQAQNQSLTAGQFQKNVCDGAGALIICSNLYVNVQTFSTFSGISMLDPINKGKIDSSTMNYSLGGPGDIVLVQAFYQWPVIAGPLGFDLSNLSNSSRLLVATAVFRNEPYR
jgi:Flp pilus assembly protein TadG